VLARLLGGCCCFSSMLGFFDCLGCGIRGWVGLVDICCFAVQCTGVSSPASLFKPSLGLTCHVGLCLLRLVQAWKLMSTAIYCYRVGEYRRSEPA